MAMIQENQELIDAVWKELEIFYSFDRNDLMDILQVPDLRSVMYRLKRNVKDVATEMKMEEHWIKQMWTKLSQVYRLDLLEMTLSSFNYSTFIPFVRTLLFSRTDTLFTFLETTIKQRNCISPSSAVERALVAKQREFGFNLIHSDERDIDISPTVSRRSQQCQIVENYYAEEKDNVEKAAISILRNHRAYDLYYCLSCQTVPDPVPIRLIHDRVHANIEFAKWIFEFIIDTKPVQRLRNVQQLGVCSRVYPSGNHTRFDHSLGVGHLASSFFDRLVTASGYRHDRETYRIRNCLAIAGICHDLGHGPFSHTFEMSFVNELEDESKRQWRHEQMSECLIEYIFQNPKLQHFPDEDVRLIISMIRGDTPLSGRTWCSDTPESLLQASYSIISNKHSGTDVDRFDYLQRDQMIGDNLRFFKANRIMEFAKVIDGTICYRDKEHDNVFKMFESRYWMFRWVYTHPKVRAFELMMIDALKEVEPIFKTSDAIGDVESFLNLDDSIIRRISWEDESKYDSEDRQRIRSAKKLLQRMDTRQSYRFAGEVEISASANDKRDINNITIDQIKQHVDINQIKEHFTPRSIISCAECNEAKLRDSDIIVDWNTIDYGTKDQNPMNRVLFFSKNEDRKPFYQKAPYETDWQSHCARVYCRDNIKADALSAAFARWTKSYVTEPFIHFLALGGARQEAQSPCGSVPNAVRRRDLCRIPSPDSLPGFPRM